jgi:hypothetical protein
MTSVPFLASLPRAPLLAALLLAAPLCPWLAGGSSADTRTPGVGVPVPAAWEAVRPGTLSGQGGGRLDWGLERVRFEWRSGTSSLPAPTPLVDATFDGRDLLLRWGRLLLEGG